MGQGDFLDWRMNRSNPSVLLDISLFLREKESVFPLWKRGTSWPSSDRTGGFSFGQIPPPEYRVLPFVKGRKRSDTIQEKGIGHKGNRIYGRFPLSEKAGGREPIRTPASRRTCISLSDDLLHLRRALFPCDIVAIGAIGGSTRYDDPNPGIRAS